VSATSLGQERRGNYDRWSRSGPTSKVSIDAPRLAILE
jgi:hypothetical protein